MDTSTLEKSFEQLGIGASSTPQHPELNGLKDTFSVGEDSYITTKARSIADDVFLEIGNDALLKAEQQAFMRRMSASWTIWDR